MRVSKQGEIAAMPIEECQRLDAPLRDDLEVLDYEVRTLVARIRREACDAGTDDTTFVAASTTVLLSIAAGLIACAADERRAAFDARSFAASANRAADWARKRRLLRFVAGEA